MTFDPWETSGGGSTTTEKVKVGERTFSKTLYDRAHKRVDDVQRISGRKFIVTGNSKLGDTYPMYEVHWQGDDQYVCDCYSLSHGEQRAKRTCSHVLAVMIYRSELGHKPSVDGGDGKVDQPALPIQATEGSKTGPLASTTSTTEVPAVNDHRFVEWDPTPIPDKFVEIRPHQWDAIGEACEHFQRGVEGVYVDAPTGSGKTLIAELTRRIVKLRAFYICHSKSLQEQFASEFAYAKVLKGRANYPTLDRVPDVTCADCTKNDPEDECRWCSDPAFCPYEVAKGEAIRSRLAILNTAYFLAEFNYVGRVGKQRELGIIDECDTLESELMDFAEFRIGERMLHACNVEAPKEGSHRTTIGKWLVDDFRPALYDYMKSIKGDDVRTVRERLYASRMMADVLRISEQVAVDEGLTQWVRDVKAGPLVLKPIVVHDYGDRYVWRHARRWLQMSATIISADELSESCGFTGGQGEGEQGRRWELVTVPMTFPVENRRITIAPVADMSRKGKESGQWEHAATALRRIAERHPTERILVHTVSYELARFLMDRVARSLDRPVLTYNESSARDNTLRRFRQSPNAVLVAASMDRGVDLAGDECRVVVVMKVPFPYLGDRRVGERMRQPGGQTWYVVQAIRKLVQMTGRAVRSQDDWCHTYILDQQFNSNIWKKHRALLPKWWKEAVEMNFNVRELLQ